MGVESNCIYSLFPLPFIVCGGVFFILLLIPPSILFLWGVLLFLPFIVYFCGGSICYSWVLSDEFLNIDWGMLSYVGIQDVVLQILHCFFFTHILHQDLNHLVLVVHHSATIGVETNYGFIKAVRKQKLFLVVPKLLYKFF